MKACSQSMVVGRSDSASGERRGSGGSVEGGERISVPDSGACDVLDGFVSEGEEDLAEPDHQEDQDEELLVAAGGVLDALAGDCSAVG